MLTSRNLSCFMKHLMIVHFLNPEHNQCAIYSSKTFKINRLTVFFLSFPKTRTKNIKTLLILSNDHLEIAD